MGEALENLKTRLAEVHHLGMAGAVLDWDQQTYMPPGGLHARAEQKAVISRLSHNLFVDPEVGRLLEKAAAEVADLDPDDEDASLVRVARRDYEKATRLPEALVTEITRVTSHAQEEWAKARATDDYDHFAPWLEKIIDLERQVAEAFGYQDRLYDALIDQYEPGMTSAQIDAIFADLKEKTVPLAKAIFERVDEVDSSVLTRDYDPETQRLFAEEVLKDCGFDFERGRQDRSVHPFCTHFSRGDVRLTTRYDRNFLPMALFGSLHEMGHGLYEQGTSPSLDGTLLGNGCSLGVHESQSRLWENLVGRSRAFWSHYFPKLREAFPTQLADVDEEDFYRAINRVSPSLIRVEADEVTYNLHIILRYEMENALLEGRLSVKDAPDAWNAKMEELLGITPPTNREGILQDVHWSMGIMGYFPTYALGNVLSAQIWEKALDEVPSIPADVRRGYFEPLLAWLRENIHSQGRKYLPAELIRKATGQDLSTDAYVRYLNTKFRDIYAL